MTFIRKHREAILSGLACALIALVANREQLCSDARTVQWSKEYAVSGSQANLNETMEEIQRDTFEHMRGSWSGRKGRPAFFIKVELLGA